MLLRITNKCTMKCSHCFLENVSEDGKHMEMDMFKSVFRFIHECNCPVVLISGGEPTLHPNFLWILDQFLIKSAKKIVVTSNGTFLDDKELVNALEDRALIWSDRFLVQITNDPRYYPRKIPEVPGCFYFTEKIPSMNPCKRQRENGYIVNRRGPGCFNLRSATFVVGFPACIFELAIYGKFCQPSIDIDGTIRAGETDNCHKIGTVKDDFSTIEKSIVTSNCDRCGLHKGLNEKERLAIKMLGKERK